MPITIAAIAIAIPINTFFTEAFPRGVLQIKKDNLSRLFRSAQVVPCVIQEIVPFWVQPIEIIGFYKLCWSEPLNHIKKSRQTIFKKKANIFASIELWIPATHILIFLPILKFIRS